MSFYLPFGCWIVIFVVVVLFSLNQGLTHLRLTPNSSAEEGLEPSVKLPSPPNHPVHKHVPAHLFLCPVGTRAEAQDPVCVRRALRPLSHMGDRCLLSEERFRKQESDHLA